MLKTGNGKQYRIGDSVIAPYGYLVFPRAATKLTLRNTGEELFLYDNSGTLVDKSRFLGSAPEDRSVSRFGETFSFAIPTPGGANREDPARALVGDAAVQPGTIYARLGTADVAWLAAGMGCVFTAAVIIFIIRHHALQKFFFERD